MYWPFQIAYEVTENPHKVDMKNVVECQKEFFAYFNALETQAEYLTTLILVISFKTECEKSGGK